MITEIQKRLVDAMKAGDKKHVTVLRDMKSNLTEAEKIKKKELTEQECFDVLDRMAKKRKQSIEACGDHFKYQELKQQEEFELTVIEEYLPEKMSIDELKDAIQQIISVHQISYDMSNLGKVMKSFNEQYQNQDSKLVAKLVRESLTV